MTRSDGEIVMRVRSGDRELYGELVQRHQAGLYRYALGMVGSGDVAADLVQDALVRAYTRIASCKEPERFGPWVFRILRNACLDHLKNRRRLDVTLEPDAPFAADDDPSSAVERADLQRMISGALAELPAAQREAFLLKHVDDLSYEEIADRTGASVSALKMRVLRAREALHALIGDRATAEL